MNNNNVKIFFDYIYNKYNDKKYIYTDPVMFPHTVDGNKEYIAFTAAMFAYGQVKVMNKFLSELFDSCGTDPLHLKTNAKGLKYRFQSASDVDTYLKIMNKIYVGYGSLENLFDANISNPLASASTVMEFAKKEAIAMGLSTQGINFLFATPGESASKRLVMFLRWMVRKDEIDFGLWQKFSPADLVLPVDVHIHRFAQSIGIVKESEKGVKALEKVISFFKEIAPNDPAKYDFAITRLGMINGCKYTKTNACDGCLDSKLCVFN